MKTTRRRRAPAWVPLLLGLVVLPVAGCGTTTDTSGTTAGVAASTGAPAVPAASPRVPAVEPMGSNTFKDPKPVPRPETRRPGRGREGGDAYNTLVGGPEDSLRVRVDLAPTFANEDALALTAGATSATPFTSFTVALNGRPLTPMAVDQPGPGEMRLDFSNEVPNLNPATDRFTATVVRPDGTTVTVGPFALKRTG